jgi:hypothetical protein
MPNPTGYPAALGTQSNRHSVRLGTSRPVITGTGAYKGKKADPGSLDSIDPNSTGPLDSIDPNSTGPLDSIDADSTGPLDSRDPDSTVSLDPNGF